MANVYYINANGGMVGLIAPTQTVMVSLARYIKGNKQKATRQPRGFFASTYEFVQKYFSPLQLLQAESTFIISCNNFCYIL